MRNTTFMTIMLIACQIFPIHLFAAPKGKTSFVVVPVHDGTDDAVSDAAAGELSNLLSLQPHIHVVEKDKAGGVLQYYDRKDDPRLSDVEELISKAKENYYRFNYIEAKSLINKAVSSLKGIPGAVYDYGKNLLDAYLTLGIVSKSMGNVGEARQAFGEAIRLDPNYKLDSRAFSPSMVNMFEEVKSSSKIGQRGSVRIESNPKVAEVYLNGILKGVTPLTIADLSQGVYFLKISANKYSPVQKEINLKSGESLKIKEELVWSEGKTAKGGVNDFVSAAGKIGQINEGLKIADLLRVEKVLLVDAGGGGRTVAAQIVDAKYRAGQKPIVASYQGKGGLADLAKEVAGASRVNIATNPEKYVEPVGKGEPELLGDKKERRFSKPLLWGILGGVVAAGVGGGLAAALAGGGGGGGNNGTGSVNVNFK